MRPKSICILSLLLIALTLWASAFVGIRYALQSYHPASLALLRYLVASICMFFFYRRLHNLPKLKQSDFPMLALTAILGITVYNIVLNYSELVVSASVASFIVCQAPVITTVLAVLFLGERARRGLWLGLGLSIVGVTLIAISHHHEFSFFHYGVLYALFAAAACSLYSVLQKPLLNRLHPVQFTSYAIWIGTLALLPYTHQLIRDIQIAPASETLTVVYLGIFPAAIAYILWSYVLAHFSVIKSSSLLYLSPLITTLLAWGLLKENPRDLAIIGGLIAILGAYIVHKRKHLVKVATTAS